MTDLLAPFGWQPIHRAPRRLWIACSLCRCAVVNEDRHLRGWHETVHAPRFCRCPDCSAADSAPEGDVA